MTCFSAQKPLSIFVLIAIVFSICLESSGQQNASSTPLSKDAAKKYQITTSFSILQDLAEQIATPDFQISTLVGKDQDAHSYQPKPSDLKLLSKSNLFIINGLGFESWASKLITSSQFMGRKITVTQGLIPLSFSEDKTTQDPHAWQNPTHISLYCKQIADALISIAPEHKVTIEANAAAYMQKILAKHEQIRVKYLTLPAAKRRVITTHDAFQYYGKAYGIEFLSAQGISTESDPSAKKISRLIKQIRQQKIDCLFLEIASNPKLLQQIQSETKAKIGGTLHSDSLSTTGASTYLEMMESNFQQIYSCLSN